MDYTPCVLLFCDLGTAKTVAKMFIISGKPDVTPEFKLMKATPSNFAPYKMPFVAETGFRARNKGYISLTTEKLSL